MIVQVSWTPEDEAAGRAVRTYILATSGSIILTGGDVWRWLTAQLIEAEYSLDAMAWVSGKPATSAPFSSMRVLGADRARRQAAVDAGGVWPLAPERGRLAPVDMGQMPLWMYQAAQYRARQVVRSARPSSYAPTFRTAVDQVGPGPLYSAASVRGGSVQRAAPVLVLVGVLGVAALVAAGYVGGEAVHETFEVDRYKARLAAETAVKSQVAMAQLAKGEKVDLSALVVGAGEAEERNRWLLPVAAFGGGVVAAGAAGVALWRRGSGTRRQGS